MIDVNKTYISPYDEFLFEFDATHPKSLSQQAEINKYAKIFAARDGHLEVVVEEIWEDF